MTAPRTRHRERRERFEARREAGAARAGRLVRWRTATFLAALVLGVVSEWTGGTPSMLLAVAAAGCFAGFLVLVARHRGARREVRWHEELAALAAEGLARLDRRWGDLPEVGEAPPPEDHPYASDLDVTGAASLRRLLGTPATPPGREALRGWLLAPAGEDEIRARQEAVAELADRHAFREELAARGRLAGEADAAAFRDFLAWCEGESWLAGRGALRAAAWLLPASTFVLATLHATGVVGTAWWALGPAFMLGVVGLVGGALDRQLAHATAGEAELERYADVLETLAAVEGEAEAVDGIRTALSAGEDRREDGEPAAEAIRSLGRRAAWAEARRSGLLHFVLQVLFLWDVHALRSLERWRDRHGEEVRAWLAALGRGEALCALATLQADHPDWCLPTLRSDGDPRLEARGLDHPLLPPSECVSNDVSVGPPGTFLLVTGSNMSGKSTLLRAAGLAVVLARAGGPVPARSCSLSLLRVHTVMQVRDSLAEGVSQYLAELHRVARVVAAAQGDGPDRPRAEEPVLYLLDEPLQGTNEAERRVALRTVLRHLLRTDAVGAVATHDLRLHEVEDLEAAARPVHFTGTVEEAAGGPRLTFDYRLREGPATSTNALDLLRAVGLGADDPNGGA